MLQRKVKGLQLLLWGEQGACREDEVVDVFDLRGTKLGFLGVDSNSLSAKAHEYSSATPVGDPERSSGARSLVTDSPTRVIDSPERSSGARSARVADTSDKDGRARVTSSPTRAIDSSERPSQPEDSPQKETSWTLPYDLDGVETGAMPTTDLERICDACLDEDGCRWELHGCGIHDW